MGAARGTSHCNGFPGPMTAVDVVVASRSFTVDDARDALARMDRLARRRVYLTYSAGDAHRDEAILSAIGRKSAPRPDYLLLLLILHGMGIRASLDFIEGSSERTVCSSPGDLIRRVEWSLGPIDDKEKDALVRYFETLPREDGEAILPVSRRRWARIGWEK